MPVMLDLVLSGSLGALFLVAVVGVSLSIRSLFLLVALLASPVLFLYAYNATWRIYSDHGFFHSAIVYQILNGVIPPQNPILGNEPLLYSWGHHLFSAALVYLLDIAPSWVFAALNVLALSIALIGIHAIVRSISARILAPALAMLLAIFGCSLFTRGPFAEAAKIFTKAVGFPAPVTEYKALAIAKFYNLSSNGIGIAGFILVLYAVLQVVSRTPCRKRDLALLTSSVPVTIFFYPLCVIDIVVAVSSIVVFVAAMDLRSYWRNLVYTSTSTGIGLALIAPFLFAIGSGRSESLNAVTHDFGWFAGKSIIVLVGILPVIAILLVSPNELRRLWREHPIPVGSITIVSVALFAVYVCLEHPTGAEYKHFLLGLVCAGILAGVALAALHERHKIAALVLSTCFLIPFMSDFLDIARAHTWPYSDELAERGKYAFHTDPNEGALQAWIGDRTERDAVFIDTYLTIPMFGRRQLLIGSDIRQKELARIGATGVRPIADGWEMSPESLLLPQGYDPKMIETRAHVVNDLYAPRSTLDQDTLSFLKAWDRTPLYIVVRDAPTDKKIASHSIFRKVFEVAHLKVYRVIGPF